MQKILGSIPHEFTNYWISKFPHLISHAYHAFSICSNEPIFQTYYNSSYHFTRPEYFDADDDLFPTLLLRDPKPIMKQQQSTNNGSPRRTQQTSLHPRNRKGTYNFRKTTGDEDAPLPQGGLHRNMDNTSAEDGGKHDVFANFRFKRHPKTSNRNLNSNIVRDIKSVTWTLNSTPLNKDE